MHERIDVETLLRLLDVGEQAVLAAALDPAAEVAAYCGSGVSACETLLRLHEAGRDDARLYVGSWSDWSQRAELPIATGA